jgi:aminoglycoside phosphotransferase (APT) family kinase protein
MPVQDLAGRLSAVMQRAMGASGGVEALAPITGGATKQTFAFDARIGAHQRRFILQLSGASGDKAAAYTPKLSAQQDAGLMQAAAARGVLAPEVCVVLQPGDGLGSGYITARIAGEALGRRIVHDPQFAQARQVLAAQFAANLARIHQMDPDEHQDLVAFGAKEQITSYAGIVEHYGVVSPALEYALAWSREHAPARARMAVVHADFRMGNVLVDEAGLTGVLDWEAAHRGDPMQDLGYLCVRTWRFGGAHPVGGGPVDRAAVHFWEAWGNIKWAIIAMRKGLRYRDGVEPVSLEQCAIGRRMEEPLWDFFQLIEGEKS